MTGVTLDASIAALKRDCADTCNGVDNEENKSCSRWMGFLVQSDMKLMPMNEHISLRAMIAYTAHNTRQPEFKIEKELSDRFAVPNVNYLPADKYEQVIALLSDQVSKVS